MKKNRGGAPRGPRPGGSWQGARSRLEELVEAVINTDMAALRFSPEMRTLAYRVLQFDARRTRVVILGGGTGLSTVVGGNAQRPDWARMPFVGLKEEFPRLKVVVCTTDDGGSTGRLLKTMPMIAIGDLRKSALSLILSENLQRAYRLRREESYGLVQCIQRIFNHRFAERPSDAHRLADPLLVLPVRQRAAIPRKLAERLRALGAYVAAGGRAPGSIPRGTAWATSCSPPRSSGRRKAARTGRPVCPRYRGGWTPSRGSSARRRGASSPPRRRRAS